MSASTIVAITNATGVKQGWATVYDPFGTVVIGAVPEDVAHAGQCRVLSSAIRSSDGG